MELLFILLLSWLVTAKAVANGARDWQLAKQGQLPPRVALEIERLKAAGQLAADANITPQEAFGVLRRSGTGWSSYWRRLRDDTFDAMRERHEMRDGRRRQKRQQKREGTYEPGAAERLWLDYCDAFDNLWDRTFDAWTDRRRRRRRQRQGQEDEPEPVHESEPNPAAQSDSQPQEPAPAPEPERELEPDINSDAETGQQPNPEPNPAASPDSEPDHPGADPNSTSDTDTNETDTNETATGQEEESMTDGTTSGNGQAGAGGGELNSQRKLAMAEQRIAELAEALLAKAEAIAASAAANRLDTDEINQGIDRLQTMRTRWATAGDEHEQAAAAATDVVNAHRRHIAADLDYDVANN